MSQRLDRSTVPARYLLGELSEQEEESFEERYFSDERLFEELQITEAEVIDAYANNELPQKARQHLEERLEKSPRLRERLAFARTFARSIPELPPETSAEPLLSSRPIQDSWWKTMFVAPLAQQRAAAWARAASVFVILGVPFMIVQTVRLRNESRRLESERATIALQRQELVRLANDQQNQIAGELREAQRRYALAETLAKALTEPQDVSLKTKPVVASLTLLPGSLRSGQDVRELKLSSKTSTVQLYLALVTVDYKTYRVVITGPDNKEIRKDRVKPTSRKTLAVQLPPHMIASGEYTVVVSGLTPTGEVEPVNDYLFKVIVK